MQDLEKLVKTAIEYRIAILKAKEIGIIGYGKTVSGDEHFQLYEEEDFAEIIQGREYKVKNFYSEYSNYKYETYVSGLKFICLTEKLLFDGDEMKIEEEI